MTRKGKNVTEGWYNAKPIDRDRYGERNGLEGPFMTKAGKVVYYDPREGAYYDPDSDIYLSYEEWKALDESLPPHLAKFIGTDGDWTPDAKGRLGKDGVNRLARQQPRDVTPAGYGPGDGRQMVTKKIGTISKKGLGEAGDRTVTTYLMVEMVDGRPGTNWTLVKNTDHPGNNPIYLRKILTDQSKRLGWEGWKVITQWRGDIDEELADAQEKLASGNNWITSYEIRLKEMVRDLTRAKEVMANGTEVNPSTTEARDPHEVIRKFLDKKKSREARSAELAKNPEKVNQLNNDEPLQETDAMSTDDVRKKVNVAVMSSDLSPILVRKYRQRIANAMSGEELYDIIQNLAKEGVFVDGKTKSRDWNFLLDETSQLDEYKPGVTTLTRELSFADTAGTQFDIHDPDAEYATIKKIRWPYGIDVSFNDRTRTVRFKTAKMKTVAKILDKHIDFGAISAAEALDLPPELMGEAGLGTGMKKFKQWYGTDPRDVKKRIQNMDPAFRDLVANHQGELGGAAELQRRLSKKVKTEPSKKLGEGMPSSVIKHKQKYANMSDAEVAAALGDKSEEQLRQMAWRHGYGKMSDHYVRRVAKGKSMSTPIGEAMPTNGSKVTIAIKGEKVRDIQLPPHAKVHHIAQELRKVPLGLSELEIMNAARELARGGIFRRGSLGMQMQGTTPREMR